MKMNLVKAKKTGQDVTAIMKPWRARIDAMDRDIIALIAKRTELIRKIGAMKARERIDATIPARVKQVVDNAVEEGRKSGLDEKMIRDIYRALVYHSCEIEEDIRSAHDRKNVG